MVQGAGVGVGDSNVLQFGIDGDFGAVLDHIHWQAWGDSRWLKAL